MKKAGIYETIWASHNKQQIYEELLKALIVATELLRCACSNTLLFAH